jgi:ribonuclease Z
MPFVPTAMRDARMGSMLALVAVLASGCLERRLVAEFTRADRSLLAMPGMTVALCGTGTGLADAHRAGACTAIIAGGRMFLVDVGPGAWKTVDLTGLPVADLGGVLLTKLLADDTADLGETITRSWLAGRPQPLAVYGPRGTVRVVAGILQAEEYDVAMRRAHHDQAVLRPELAVAEAHELTLDGPADSALVLDENGLRITAFSVGAVAGIDSVGYRFDYGGRSVVVSGHARHQPNLVAHAVEADVLVHEASSPEMLERGLEVMQHLGSTRLMSFTREMRRTYPTAVEAAEVARDAHVGLLVLSRLAPPPTTALERWLFLRGARDIFPHVVLGEDGWRDHLDPQR